MNRLLSELGSLARSLPLSEGSTVFLRCDEKRIDVMKALIIGPQDTPYQNGTSSLIMCACCAWKEITIHVDNIINLL